MLTFPKIITTSGDNMSTYSNDTIQGISRQRPIRRMERTNKPI